MHPDQFYSTRQLQHADLIAEAERERRGRAVRGSRQSWLTAVLRRWSDAALRRRPAEDRREPEMAR